MASNSTLNNIKSAYCMNYTYNLCKNIKLFQISDVFLGHAR